VGILDRRTAKRLEHDRAEQEKDHADAVAQWQAEDAQLRELLLEAQNPAWAERVSLILKKDERAFQVLEGAALIEPRRLSGHWEGRSQGVSLRVAKGVHYRVGKSTGHYVQGAEVPTPIDTGTLTITNRRVVFQGPKATREWAFSKLIGFQHVDLARAPWTAIQVSNRQKTSGFLYTPAVSLGVRFRLDLALAHYNGEVDELVRALQEQLERHTKERPGGPACPVPALGSDPATAVTTPAGWHRDPTGRHELRYWDGRNWTEHVSDEGIVGDCDPLVPASGWALRPEGSDCRSDCGQRTASQSTSQ